MTYACFSQKLLFDIQDLILDKKEFLERAVETLGSTMNTFISAMHHDPGYKVKFLKEKKVYKCDNITVVKKVAVSDPSDPQLCPEAHDGREVLYHMRHYCNQYADAIDYQSYPDFKEKLKQIIGKVPKKQCHALTWYGTIDTIYLIKSFIEMIVEGLESTNRLSLAESTRPGIEKLRVIAERAIQARELKK